MATKKHRDLSSQSHSLWVHLLQPCLVIVILASSAVAQSRTGLTLPTGYDTTGSVYGLAFVLSGTIGLTVGRDIDGDCAIFSFLTATGAMASITELQSDFGSGENVGAAVQSFDSLGLVAAYGVDRSGNQMVVMFSFDQQGVSTRMWAQTFQSPDSPLFDPIVQFNADGSRIYVMSNFVSDGGGIEPFGVCGFCPVSVTASLGGEHTKTMRAVLPAQSPPDYYDTLTMLDSSDGSVIDSLVFPGGVTSFLGLNFDPVSDRLVAMVNSVVYVFADDPAGLGQPAKLGELSGPDDEAAYSTVGVVGGRYLVSYGEAEKGSLFFSTDLNAGTTSTFITPGRSQPFTNNMAVDQPAMSVMVPYSYKVTIHNDDIDIMGDIRQFDILPLSPDGVIQSALRTKLPSPFILGDNAMASKSGAICFLATGDGNMYSVDALSGDVVNRTELTGPSSLDCLTLDSATNQIVFESGPSVGIIASPDHPVISAVRFERNRSVIEGVNFLQGAQVSVNGQMAPILSVSSIGTGTEVIIAEGKAEFGSTGTVSLTVTNRDGLVSNTFSAAP